MVIKVIQTFDYTIILQSKSVVTPFFGLFGTPAGELRYVRVPVSPVNGLTAGHFMR